MGYWIDYKENVDECQCQWGLAASQKYSEDMATDAMLERATVLS